MDLILLSLPNMGTDWLAEKYAQHNPSLKYFREFFNPITNQEYLDVLGTAFGSEMVSNHKNIADPNVPIEEVFQATWMKTNHNFTKENYSPFRLEFFSKEFKCFVLLRKTELVFPPSRWEVVAWYDAIWNSLTANKTNLEPQIAKLVDFSERHANTVNKRIVAACEICTQKITTDAKKFNIPVIHYESLMLMSKAELKEYIKGLPGVSDPNHLSELIVTSRRPKRNTFDKTGATDFLNELRRIFQPTI